MDGMSGCGWGVPQRRVPASAPEENFKSRTVIQDSMQMSVQLHASCSPTCKVKMNTSF